MCVCVENCVCERGFGEYNIPLGGKDGSSGLLISPERAFGLRRQQFVIKGHFYIFILTMFYRRERWAAMMLPPIALFYTCFHKHSFKRENGAATVLPSIV